MWRREGKAFFSMGEEEAPDEPARSGEEEDDGEEPVEEVAGLAVEVGLADGGAVVVAVAPGEEDVEEAGEEFEEEVHG